MKVVVVYVSRHGATAGIANVIGEVLNQRGLVAIVRPASEVEALADFDAAVLGSALYMGQWLKVARIFAKQHEQELSTMPLWLYSSGPIGDPPFPREGSPAVASLASQLGARGHQTFAGKLDRAQLSLVEELMTTALRAPEGDFRDWQAIREWAGSIAEELLANARPAKENVK